MLCNGGTYEDTLVADVPNSNINYGRKLTYFTATISYTQTSVPLRSDTFISDGVNANIVFTKTATGRVIGIC